MLRTCTQYLTLGMASVVDEIEVEVSYHLSGPGDNGPASPADVEIASIKAGSTDIRSILPDRMEAEVAKRILQSEMAGEYA